MILLNEKQSLIEMSLLARKDAPKDLQTRVTRLVIDDWFYDQAEDKKDLEKVAFRISLGIAPPKIHVDFDYGFLKRHYNYSKRPAKLSGRPDIQQWKFRALHLISNIPELEGQWGRIDFNDKEFEDIVTHEIQLARSNNTNINAIRSFIAKYKLKKCYGNILQLCRDALKGRNDN